MRRFSRARTLLRPFLLVGLFLAVDLVAGVLASVEWVGAGLTLHLGASATLLVLAWRQSGALTTETATLRVAALLMAALGPIALSLALLTLVVQATGKAVTADAETWYEHLFPKATGDALSEHVEAANRNAAAKDDLEDLASFHDVMRWGSFSEKEHVLTLIGRSFRPEFAPILREALSGDDPGLRAQAAIGLSSLEERFSTRLDRVRDHYRAANGLGEVMLELVDTLAEGAHSGLFDADRTNQLRREIVDLLAPRFMSSPDPAIGARLGRTLIQLGEPDSAVDVLEAVLSIEPSHAAAFTWLLEAHFRRRAFAQLSDFLDRRREQVAALIELDGPLAPALQLWMQPA